MKELAGKKADYAVTLREIKQKVLPELNDAFAAKLSEGQDAGGIAATDGARSRARERA